MEARPVCSAILELLYSSLVNLSTNDKINCNLEKTYIAKFIVCYVYDYNMFYMDGLVQDCSNSIANDYSLALSLDMCFQFYCAFVGVVML